MSLQQTIEDYLRTHIDAEGYHLLFPRTDWARDCEEGNTNQGYRDWLDSKIEMEVDTVQDAITRLFHTAPRAFMGDMDEEQFNNIVLDTMSDLRCMDDEAADRARRFLGEDEEEEKEFLFSETFQSAPDDIIQAVRRICHLGMVAHEGRSTPEKIDEAIVEFSKKFDMNTDETRAALIRLGQESPAP